MHGSYKLTTQNDTEDYTYSVRGSRLLGSCRINLVIMVFLGMFIHYFIRLNISLAIVCMVVERTDINETKTVNKASSFLQNDTIPNPCISENILSTGNATDKVQESITGELQWDRQMMTNVLAAYFYGYVPVQVVGGWLASKYGGKHVYGIGLLSASILTLLTPVAARTHPFFLMILRIFIGVGTGVTFPSAQAMFGRWIPIYERSKLIAIGLIGSIAGAVFAFGITGLLCTMQVDNGWPFAFYIPGAVGVLWWAAFHYLVYSNPHEHPRITDEEKSFILYNICEKENSSGKTKQMPWKGMFTSPAVWGIVIGHLAQGFGLYTATGVLPMYMNDVLNFNVKQNGALSALPQICLAISTPVVGYVVDLLRSKQVVSTSVVRKTCQAIALVVCSAFFIGASFLDCTQRTLAVAMITIAISSLSFGRVGYMVNNVDIAPRYSGLIYSFTNTIANATGFVIPLLVGALTPNGTREEWQMVFYIHSGIMIFGAIGFALLAKGEIQSWAMVFDENKEIS